MGKMIVTSFTSNVRAEEKKPRTIGPFSGQFRFLSNFFPAKVMFEGMTFPTAEHAYQAAKTLDLTERASIQSMPTPGQTKRAGRRITLRPDWERVKLTVMEDLLRQKFSDPELRRQLLVTHPHPIVELNTWGDTFWGVCNGVGQNYLGRILMKIRSESIASKY